MTEPTSSKERAANIIRRGQETPNDPIDPMWGHHASVFRVGEDLWMVSKGDEAPTASDPRITTQELREVWTKGVCMWVEDPEGGDADASGDDPEEVELQIEGARVHTQYA